MVPLAIGPALSLKRLQASPSVEARGPSTTRPFACRFLDVGWLSPVRSSARRQLATQRYACVTPSWLRVGQRCRRMAPTERMAPRPRFAEARCHASFEAHGMAAPTAIPVSLPKIGTRLRRSARVQYSQKPDKPGSDARISRYINGYETRDCLRDRRPGGARCSSQPGSCAGGESTRRSTSYWTTPAESTAGSPEGRAAGEPATFD